MNPLVKEPKIYFTSGSAAFVENVWGSAGCKQKECACGGPLTLSHGARVMLLALLLLLYLVRGWYTPSHQANAPPNQKETGAVF